MSGSQDGGGAGGGTGGGQDGGGQGQGEDRVGQLEQRLGGLEAEQREQRGILERIADAIPGLGQGSGGGGDGGQGDGGQGSAGVTYADFQTRVRAEIEDAERRRREEGEKTADAEWRKSVNEQLEKLKPEQAPREPQAGVRGRLQRAMFGSDR